MPISRFRSRANSDWNASRPSPGHANTDSTTTEPPSKLPTCTPAIVTTARAKGLTETRITLAHVFRNAVLPVVTMAGVQVGSLLGGSVVVESVFAWPGLGLLAFQSLFARDLNLLMGIFFLSACLVVSVNLVVDLVYTALDPRIHV